MHTYTCKYVPTCLLIHVSGEISPTPGLEGNNKIGWWYNNSVLPRVFLIFGTCGITPLNGGLWSDGMSS